MNAYLAATDVADKQLWKKSSYSEGTDNSSIEVIDLTSRVGIRDS